MATTNMTTIPGGKDYRITLATFPMEEQSITINRKVSVYVTTGTNITFKCSNGAALYLDHDISHVNYEGNYAKVSSCYCGSVKMINADGVCIYGSGKKLADLPTLEKGQSTTMPIFLWMGDITNKPTNVQTRNGCQHSCNYYDIQENEFKLTSNIVNGKQYLVTASYGCDMRGIHVLN